MNPERRLCFASHPGDEAFQAVSSSGRRIISRLSVGAPTRFGGPRAPWAIFAILLRAAGSLLRSSSLGTRRINSRHQIQMGMPSRAGVLINRRRSGPRI